MFKSKARILYLTLAAIFTFLVIANPSRSDFNDFLGFGGDNRVSSRRVSNYFVCSVYAWGPKGIPTVEFGRYFGIAGNFFELKKEKVPKDKSKPEN